MNDGTGVVVTDVQPMERPPGTWPSDAQGEFLRGWSATANWNGKQYRLQHALGRATVYGRVRPRFATWINGRACLQGLGADDHETSHCMISLLSASTKSRRNLLNQSEVQPEYAGREIVPYSDHVDAKGAFRGLALRAREDDLEAWALHALLRYRTVYEPRDLRDPAVLRALYEGPYQQAMKEWSYFPRWLDEYSAVVARVREAPPGSLESPEFQAPLWDAMTGVASLGPGNNPHLSRQEGYAEFVGLAARLCRAPLPADRAARVKALEAVYDQLVLGATTLMPGLNKRRPMGKVVRFMGALFPRDICSLATDRYITPVAQALTGVAFPHPIAMHCAVMEAIEKALGPAADTPRALAERGAFPWFLHKSEISAEKEDPGPDPGFDPEVPDSAGSVEPAEAIPFKAPDPETLLAAFAGLPFVFPRDLVARMHLALHANEKRHFVLLSGLSGTGKTRLASLYADLYNGLEADEENEWSCLIPVQPDWTDPTGLLGYVNPIREGATYEHTQCLEFLLHAGREPSRPHFLILDEMNLARPEHYFAPFLSSMETGKPLVIHSQGAAVDLVPPTIPWPENLFIIGTVNMDETTHAFSDKVLDRAFTMELWDVDLQAFRGKLTGYPEDLLEYAFHALQRFHEILVPLRTHLGYRSIEEILRFLRGNETGGRELLPRTDALDHVLYMKLLPRIRGEDSAALRKGLGDLRAVAVDLRLTRCGERLQRMQADLVATGMTRFWS